MPGNAATGSRIWGGSSAATPASGGLFNPAASTVNTGGTGPLATGGTVSERITFTHFIIRALALTLVISFSWLRDWLAPDPGLLNGLLGWALREIKWDDMLDDQYDLSGSGTGWGMDLLAAETYWMNTLTFSLTKGGIAPLRAGASRNRGGEGESFDKRGTQKASVAREPA